MEYVNSKKLEAVANFIADYEEFDFLCTQFNTSLKGDRVDIPCDDEGCNAACPFYSKENFIKWIKKPDSKYDVEDLEKPKQEDFLCYDNRSGRICLNDDYVKALEKYCSNLESVLADTEYDLESSECENRELQDVLKKIRGALDGKY